MNARLNNNKWQNKKTSKKERPKSKLKKGSCSKRKKR